MHSHVAAGLFSAHRKWAMCSLTDWDIYLRQDRKQIWRAAGNVSTTAHQSLIDVEIVKTIILKLKS